MKTELRDDNIPTASLSPVEDTPVGSFRRVLKNRSFLLLWLAQLLSQIVFNAANYGVIAIVTAATHSTVLVGLAIVSFTLTIAQALGFLILGGLLTVLFPSFPLSFGLLHVQVQSFDMLFALVALVYLICTFLILAIPKRALQQEQRAEPIHLTLLRIGFMIGTSMARSKCQGRYYPSRLVPCLSLVHSQHVLGGYHDISCRNHRSNTKGLRYEVLLPGDRW